MPIAVVTVHWSQGWQAIVSAKAPFAAKSLGPFRWEDAAGHYETPDAAKDVLTQCAFQTEAGRLVVLNNGIEFATTYFVMLLALFSLGGGRFQRS
jgi:putative oxidoreductase